MLAVLECQQDHAVHKRLLFIADLNQYLAAVDELFIPQQLTAKPALSAALSSLFSFSMQSSAAEALLGTARADNSTWTCAQPCGCADCRRDTGHLVCVCVCVCVYLLYLLFCLFW